jgi:hypothetical protein
MDMDGSFLLNVVQLLGCCRCYLEVAESLLEPDATQTISDKGYMYSVIISIIVLFLLLL